MHTQTATIQSRNKNHVLILLEDGQTLKIKTSELPHNLKTGDEIILEFKTRAEAEKKQQLLAQHILNEIFNQTPHN